MKHLTPIIDLTSACNLGCIYCYAGSNLGNLPDVKELNDKFSKNASLLYRFIDQIMEYNNGRTSCFVFHGGEALLINHQNWEKILNYFREKKYPVEIQLQTNGTLLNTRFISLFKEYDVKIGVSLDGPALLNDKTRIFKNGKGTFKLIFENLIKMKANGLSFGCLATVSQTNKDIEMLYNFFKDCNIPFNIRALSDSRYGHLEEILITPHDYAIAFCKLFDLWFFDNSTTVAMIGDFSNLIARFIKPLLTEKLTTCTFIKDCSQSFIAFDIESGEIWPCNCLHRAPFSYGYISNSMNLIDVMKDAEIMELSTRWERLSKTDCQSCEVQSYCYGGCPARSYDYYGSYFAKDPFCAAYKIILKHISERITSSIKKG